MANFVENEFHADTVIWYNKNSFQDLNLLPVEKHLYEVRRWGESFYPKDFVAPFVETKHLEARGWEYLEDVKNIEAEKVQRFNVSGEEVIAFKDAQGKVRVYEAYCPHQGAHLGFGAELKDGCVRCPFHGFYFDAEGRCLGPNADNKTKFITGLNLTPIEQRIEGGRIEIFV